MIQVGNKEFANFVDANIPDVTRIVNQQDPVPILPGRFLGFRHPSGEIHIGEKGEFLSCDGQSSPFRTSPIQFRLTDTLPPPTGQESEEDGCTIDSTRFIFQAETEDHSGPYGKVKKIGCGQRPL